MLTGIQTLLTEYFNDHQIINLKSMPTGWECDMYAFDLLPAPESAVNPGGQFVLRIYPGLGAAQKASSEFMNLQLLHSMGYPVPEVYYLEVNPQYFDRPFIIMHRLAGDTLLNLMTSPSGDRQQEMLGRFLDLYLELHHLDWKPFSAVPDEVIRGDDFYFIDSWLSGARRTLANYPGTGLDPILEWLVERRDQVPCAAAAVLHNDFHPGNIIVRPDGAAFVIDWTGLHVSDPRFDLAWTYLLAYAYMGKPLSDAILKGYQDRLGQPIHQMDYFLVCACARRLFDVGVSISQGSTTLGMRPETIDRMRQDFGALKQVHLLLKEITGVTIKEIDQLLAQG
jgi:aminoglycoside phosphotransferase (APT) family kinase protein